MGAHQKARSSRSAYQLRPKKKSTLRPAKAPLDPAMLAHYQLLLRVFASAFADELASEDLRGVIQDVKRALFERDFRGAFGRVEGLGMYAARWSPTRGLCYGEILRGVVTREAEGTVIGENEKEQDNSDGEDEDDDETKEEQEGKNQNGTDNTVLLDIVSIGGGPAELAAYASVISRTNVSPSLTLIDSAPWSSIITRLQTSLSTPPFLSKYASATARAANSPLLSPEETARLSVSFTQQDTLSVADDPEGLRKVIFGEKGVRKVLVTVLFTLNELYLTARGKTTMLLLSLTEILPVGSELLIVDSPGSYSEAPVGREMRRYPMRLLVEHTLLRQGCGEGKEKEWREVVETDESMWFRLPEGLEYPIALENMRYQRMWYRLEEVEGKKK